MRLPLWWCCCASLILAGFAAGCSHVPAFSLLQFARIDFVTTDPAQLRAAVKLPDALKPRPKGATLHISIKLQNGTEESRDFLLREIADPVELAVLRRELESSTQIFPYRLDPADVARLASFRADLLQKKARGEHGSLSISVHPEVCRIGELPDGPIRISTYLRTSETGRYVELTRDVDLRDTEVRRPNMNDACGVPLSNFFGWYLTVYVFFQLYAFYLGRCAMSHVDLNPQPRAYWVQPVVFYGMTAVRIILVSALSTTTAESVVDQAGVVWRADDIFAACALVCVFTMIAFTVLTLTKVTELPPQQ